MKKIITLLTILLFVVFMVGCENSINPTQPNNNQDISLAKQSNPDEAVSTLAKGGADKVEICHRKGNGDFIKISVAASAVPAHRAHGDLWPGIWNVGKTWHLDFAGGTHNREFRNLVQDAAGNVTGEFWWLTGGNWEYGGTLVGAVTDNLLYLYYDRAPIVYTGVITGVIGANEITDGTFTASSGFFGTWTATGQSTFGCE